MSTPRRRNKSYITARPQTLFCTHGVVLVAGAVVGVSFSSKATQFLTAATQFVMHSTITLVVTLFALWLLVVLTSGLVAGVRGGIAQAKINKELTGKICLFRMTNV